MDYLNLFQTSLTSNIQTLIVIISGIQYKGIGVEEIGCFWEQMWRICDINNKVAIIKKEFVHDVNDFK